MEPLLRSHTGPLKCSGVLRPLLVLEEEIWGGGCVMEELGKMEGNRGRVSRFLGENGRRKNRGKRVGINVGKWRDCFTVLGGNGRGD